MARHRQPSQNSAVGHCAVAVLPDAGTRAAEGKRWRLPFAVFLAGLVVRLAFLALEPPTRLVGDELTWLAAAKDVAASGVRFDPLRAGLVFYPPLHPYLIAVALELGGRLGVKLAQVMLGALLVPAVFAVGTRAFDRRTGILAAALAAFYPELVWQSVHFWSEPLFMALLWAAIALLLATDASSRLATAALAGATLGLTALTRDPALYFAPLAALWLCWRTKRGPTQPRLSWRPAAAFLAATLVVILPWTARNWARYQTVIPVSLMGARTFWEASVRQHAEVIDAYAAVEAAEGPVAAYRHAWRESLRSVRARQPWWLIEQVGEQVPQFWTASNLILMHLERQAYGNVSPPVAWAVLLATAVPHVLLTGAFLIALTVLPATRPRVLLLSFLGYYQLLHVVTLGHPRLRLPILPVLFLYAAALVEDARAGALAWTPFRRVVAVLLLVGFASCLAPDVVATWIEPVFGLSATTPTGLSR